MARKRTIIITLAAVILLTGLGAGGYLGFRAWQERQFLTVPPETPGHEQIFRVEPGEPFMTISNNLKAAGLITNSYRFLKLARVSGKTASIRAGEFMLNTGWLPAMILEELTTSPGIMAKAVIREGLTWWQAADVIQEAKIGTRDAFARAVEDQELLQRYGIQAANAEGYLFPETYLLTPPTDDHSRVMVELMLKEFFKNARIVWPQGLPEWKELHNTVILASLVEKESGDAGERARIAGVFRNRLKKRMLIQADPTIIYGLGPSFGGNITKSHLQDKDNPYNTYMHLGLPPGPICSPGLDALKAAAHPEDHNFLYFVAKGDGTHYFSATLQEHNNAVIKYQIRRNRTTYRSTKE